MDMRLIVKTDNVKTVFLKVDVRTMTYTVLKKQRRLEIMTTSEFDLIRKNRGRPPTWGMVSLPGE
jgi:hypothetical protein